MYMLFCECRETYLSWPNVMCDLQSRRIATINARTNTVTRCYTHATRYFLQFYERATVLRYIIVTWRSGHGVTEA